MSIYEWFGVENTTAQYNQTTESLEQLLGLYSKAICAYFHVNNISSARELISVVREKDHSGGDGVFIDWFEKKGLPCLYKVFNQPIPDSEHLKAQIEYEHYVLEKELDFIYPDDVRACLVDIISDLPDRVLGAENAYFPFDETEIIFSDVYFRDYSELSGKIIDHYVRRQTEINETTEGHFRWTSEIDAILFEALWSKVVDNSPYSKHSFQEFYHLILEEKSIELSKVKGTANEQGPFFMAKNNWRGYGLLEYYKVIRNSVQLVDVELVALECIKNEVTKQKVEVELKFSRAVTLRDSKNAEILLKTTVATKEEKPLFSFNLVYKGICISTSEISEQEFQNYLNDQVVPLLMPYARECVASTMARMKLTPYTIPTMDVLQSLIANKEGEDSQ